MIEIGRKYNLLTALYAAEPVYVSRSKRNRMFSAFKCECGTIKIIANNDVSSGKTRSCGCLKSKIKDKQLINNEYRDTSKEFILWKSQTHTVKEWAAITMVPERAILRRLSDGWTSNEIFTTPLGCERGNYDAGVSVRNLAD